MDTDNFHYVKDSEKYYKLLDKIEKIGLKHVVTSSERHNNEKLVRFTLLAEGFVFTNGKFLTVSYIPDRSYISGSKKNGFTTEFYPLDEKNWYVTYDPGD